MKRTTLTLASFALLLSSCNDKWDDHYKVSEQFVSSDKVIVVDMTVKEFLEQTPEFANFYEQFSTPYEVNDGTVEEPVIRTVDLTDNLERNQKVTVWAVSNDNYSFESVTDDYDLNVMSFHINAGVEYKYTDLRNGLKIMTLAGTPHDIAIEADDSNPDTPQILPQLNTFYLDFDDIFEADPTAGTNSFVVKSYQLNDGVVNEVSAVMIPKVTLFDQIKILRETDPNYSVICDTILNLNYGKFDLFNSTPIGMNETGNIIYDSVVLDWNHIFDDVISNKEGLVNFGNPELATKLTVILPSNDAVAGFMATVEDIYEKAGVDMELKDVLNAFTWLKKALFYRGLGVFAEGSADNINSIYGSDYVWRQSAQGTIDSSLPLKCSNGEIFFVDRVKMPTYRVQAFLYHHPNEAAESYVRLPYHYMYGYIFGRPFDITRAETLFGADDYRVKNAIDYTKEPESRIPDKYRDHVDAEGENGAGKGKLLNNPNGNIAGWYKAAPNWGTYGKNDDDKTFPWGWLGLNDNKDYVNEVGFSAPFYLNIVPIRMVLDTDGVPVGAEIMTFPVGYYRLYTGGRGSGGTPNVNIYFNGSVNTDGTVHPIDASIGYAVGPLAGGTYPDFPAKEYRPETVGVEGVEPVVLYNNPLWFNGAIGEQIRPDPGKGGNRGDIYIHPSEPNSTVGTFRLQVEGHLTAANKGTRLQWSGWRLSPSTSNY